MPEDSLSLREAIVLARARWQIELLFKLWKQSGKIDEWTSKKPYSILCDCYAKLLAVLIQHWLILTAAWHLPNRSLTKAAQTIRRFAFGMATVFQTNIQFEKMVNDVCRCISSGCRMNSRSSDPNTYQFLLNPDLLDWEGLS